MKVNGVRRQTCAVRPGRAAAQSSAAQDPNALFRNNIDSPEDIQRCLSCGRTACDGNCLPQKMLRQIPPGFLAALSKGATVQDLAVRHKVSRSTAEKWKRTLIDSVRTLGVWDRAKVVGLLHGDGMTDAEISGRTSMPVKEIAALRRLRGLPANLTREQKILGMLAMLSQGHTLKETGAAFGHGEDTVRKWTRPWIGGI